MIFQGVEHMKMLLLRPANARKDGPRRVPIVRTRARKFGAILEERCISIRRDILISGPNASGKTRWLTFKIC
jgi:Flp pilus assembly CpaF family ATPase